VAALNSGKTRTVVFPALIRGFSGLERGSMPAMGYTYSVWVLTQNPPPPATRPEGAPENVARSCYFAFQNRSNVLGQCALQNGRRYILFTRFKSNWSGAPSGPQAIKQNHGLCFPGPSGQRPASTIGPEFERNHQGVLGQLFRDVASSNYPVFKGPTSL
jgi:hypothetical protein